MKYTLSGLMFALAIACLAACGGGGDNTLAPDNATADFGGSLTVGTTGLNSIVTDNNKLTASLDVLSEVYAAFARSLRQAVTTSQAGGNQVDVSGYSYGHATTPGFTSVKQNSSGGYDYVFELTLYDYSEGGNTYLGGKLAFQGSLHLSGENWVSGDVTINQGLAFAGNFRGTLSFNAFRMPLDSLGRWIEVTAGDEELFGHPHDGSLKFISGEKTYQFNPYFRVSNPGNSPG